MPNAAGSFARMIGRSMGGTKFGKVFRGAAKKFAMTPERFMADNINKALKNVRRVGATKTRKGMTLAQARVSARRGLAKQYGKGLKYKNNKVINPTLENVPENMKKHLIESSRMEREQAGKMVGAYFNPKVSNPALKGMGEGLENISRSKLGATKLRRWGAVGASAWVGSNFLRRGDQIGPF